MSAKQTDYHDPNRGHSVHYDIKLNLDWNNPLDRAFAAIIAAVHVSGRYKARQLFAFKPKRTEHKIRWVSAGQITWRDDHSAFAKCFGGYDLLGRFREGVGVPYFERKQLSDLLRLLSNGGSVVEDHALGKHNFANPPDWFPDNYRFTSYRFTGKGDPDALRALQAFYAQQLIPLDPSFDSDPIYWTALQLLQPQNNWATPAFATRLDGTPYSISPPWDRDVPAGIFYTRFGAFQGGWTIYIPPGNSAGGLVNIGVPGPSSELGGFTPPSQRFESKSGTAWLIGALILAGALVLGGGYYATH